MSDPVVWLEVSGTDMPRLPLVCGRIEPRAGGGVAHLHYTHRGGVWMPDPDSVFCLVGELGITVPIHGVGRIALAHGDTMSLTSELTETSMRNLGLVP